MKKILLITITVFFLQETVSQNYKFGKVSKEELSEKTYPLDDEVEAASLYRNEHIYFEYVRDEGFVQKIEVHERIKIYKKEGFDYATKIIRLYDESNKKSDEISNLKAVTYNLEGGKVEETKLRNEGIFDEKTNKYWKQKKLTMPNIKEGSIVEYRYMIKSPFLKINDVVFQKNIPTKKFEFKLEIPEYYNYKPYFNPRSQYIPSINQSYKEKEVDFSYRKGPSLGLGGTTRSTKVENKKKIKFNIYSSDLNNIPGLKKEPMVSNVDNYRSKVQFELNSIQYPNEPLKPLATSWEQVTNTIFESSNFGGQIDKDNFFKDDIDVLLEGAVSNSEKIDRIYNFVKSKIKWNGFVGIYAEKGTKEAYKTGSGNVSDINLVLTSMLRYAGITSNPVLLSTKDNGIPLFPTRDGFNYVISAVEIQDGLILLDATEEFSTPNILPLRALNWQGRMIRERGSSTWVDLIASKKSNHKTFANYTIEPSLIIQGKLRNQYTNHYAYKYNSKNFNASDESVIQNLESNSVGLKVSDLSIKNKNNNKPILESYSFSMENGVDKIGEAIYLSPLLFMVSEENPFKQSLRQYPIDFGHPFSNEYMISISIPEGYTVESLPENKRVALDNNGISDFSYLVSQNGDSIQIKSSFNFNYSSVPSTDYEIFRKYYLSYLESIAEKIVLKKV